LQFVVLSRVPKILTANQQAASDLPRHRLRGTRPGNLPHLWNLRQLLHSLPIDHLVIEALPTVRQLI
jgi:hypothetical protein